MFVVANQISLRCCHNYDVIVIISSQVYIILLLVKTLINFIINYLFIY